VEQLPHVEEIPSFVKRILVEREINGDDMVIAVSSNLSLELGRPGMSWLGADKENLFILNFYHEETDEPDEWRKGKRKGFLVSVKPGKDFPDQGKKELISFNIIALADIEAVKPGNLVSSGFLGLKVKDKEMIVARYSNSQLQKFGLFTGLLEKLRKGEEITEEDVKKDEREMKCPKCGKLYPDPNRKVCPTCLDKKSLFLRVLSYAPRYWKQMTIVLIFMIVSSVLALFAPYVGGKLLFDEVLAEGGKYQGRVGFVVFLMFSTQLLSLLVNIIYSRINSSITAHIIYDLKKEIFAAMQRLSLSFFTNRETGALMSRVNHDANGLQYFFHDGIPEFLVNALKLLGIGVMLFLMEWRLALFILLPFPLSIFIINRIYPKLWSIFSRRFRRFASLNAAINNTLTGVRVVKAFGKEESEIERFGKTNQGVYAITYEAGSYMSTVFPLLEFFLGIGSFLVWGFGGWLVFKGDMTFGTLVTFAGYTGMFYGPLHFMTRVVDWWSNCMNCAQRMFEILDAIPEVVETSNPVRMPNIKGEVILKDVVFGYDKNKPVLMDINLHVQSGEIIGLVGHSGAGKSTFTNLIARLYDVDKGSILIDGVDIRDISLKDLHSQIGVVLQETFLFNGTIADNIRYARPEADMTEVIYAAKLANAHDFIVKLPDGYDTRLGSRGHNLSGGECQRLAIARAILHNPRILILDEATASVDTQTEKLIQEALERLMKGRTTFVIAHRLSTLRNADRLFVLEKGKNVECGTHEELMAKKGVYHNLLKIQRDALKIYGVS
jgi:ATP-binding cassette subfamily B protein